MFKISVKIINIVKFIIQGFFILFFLPGGLFGQYFGQNKPGYKTFDYKLYETPNFEIYHYFDNDSLLNQLARSCEEWYRLHLQVFKNPILTKNPVIFYENHADFQQTTAIMGGVSVGTGGVTEAFKNRVILPIATTNQQTDHVLGHELVHAFQYNTIINGDSTNLNSLRNLPLWMVEGMAEYLSIGSVDAHTAMWIRDGVLNKDFPTLKQLTRNSNYFPYRWGQAFWSVVAKTWGSDIIVPLFTATARIGYEAAIDSLLRISPESFSAYWKSATELYFRQFMKDSVDQLVGEKILFSGNAGNMNISPSISPDGNYVAFISERDVISLDLFLADTKTGKIIKKLSKTVNSNEVDALNYLESAGTWSPDSKKLAFGVFEKGINKLIILDVEKGRILESIKIPGVSAFTHPVWAPDGESIVVVGTPGGINDLFRYYIKTGEVKRLTNDHFSYIHPAWSPDGRYLVVSTDRRKVETDIPNMDYNLALIDLEKDSEPEVLSVFPGAKNLNPVFSSDGNSIYFLSDCDGFRNLFKYDLESGKAYRLTNYLTGITGITHYAPAISIARISDELTYSYYFNRKYTIYRANVSDFNPVEISTDFLDLAAATLPPAVSLEHNKVDKQLSNRESFQEVKPEIYTQKAYKSKFKLDYISNVTAGVSSSRLATGMSGSVYAIFSDMVGDNQMFVTLAVNGEIYDFGGQFSYLNQKKKMNWGASVSHIPYQYATAYLKPDSLFLGEDTYIPVQNLVMDYMRIFEDRFSLFAYIPFSTTRRVEFGASQSLYYYRIDRWEYFYDYYGRFIGQSREKQDAPKGFNIREIDAAFVTDNSTFGYASPLKGSRSRFQIEKYFGEFGFFTALIDYRKYFQIRPFTVATRLYHYGRFGAGSETRSIAPLYLGYPWYIRGYDNNKIYESMNYQDVEYFVEQLYGSKMVLGNLELRLPFTGPERLSLIKSKLLWTELSFFLDGGLAWWDSSTALTFDFNSTDPSVRMPIYSTGVSLRVNLFNAIILEPYYAFPFQEKRLNNGVFGLNFLPGW
jgi:Tol biopolymer transport system component